MSLLQISIAGAVMILVITVIRTLTINRVPKKTFLILWGAALIRLLIPVSLPSGLSIYSLLERHTPVLTAEPFSVSLPADGFGRNMDGRARQRSHILTQLLKCPHPHQRLSLSGGLSGSWE